MENLTHKTCNKCSEVLPVEFFSKTKASKDGRCRRCKPCAYQSFCEWREANREKIKAYDKAFYIKHRKKRLEANKERNRKWIEKNRERFNERAREYRRTQNEAPKVAVRSKWAAYKRANNLELGNCEKCGEKATEAHHNDYSKPFIVEELCTKCHKRLHSKYQIIS